jgi:imidazolonepropionase-like amidohydrolase
VSQQINKDITIPSITDDQNIWLKVGTLLDGLSSKPLTNAHVVYNSNSILYVGTTSPPLNILHPKRTKPNLELLDFTILPGLIEAHAHLFLEGGELNPEKRKTHLQKNNEELCNEARERAEKLIGSGIIAVRDAGDKNGVGLSLGKLYRSKKSLIPYIESPGAAINKKGHYGKFISTPLENYNSPEECVASRIHEGAERIKLIATDIINLEEGGVTKKPQMTISEIKDLVKVAKLFGLQTFAHASGSDGIENVIEGKIDSIEHGFFIKDDQLAKMRDRQIAWVPTFTPIQKQIQYADQLGLNEKVISNLKKILDQHANSLAKAYEIETPIVSGSDAGSLGVEHGLGFLDELELMENAGLSPLAVINSATGNSSNYLRFKEKFGQVKAGYRSRFILTKHSLLESLSNLRKEKYIIFDGIAFASHKENDLIGL